MGYIKLFENFKEDGDKLSFGKDIITSENLIGGYTIDEINDNSLFTFNLNGWGTKKFTYDGSNWAISSLYIKREYNSHYSSEFGYIVLKDDKLAYIVSIYEPHGYGLNKEKGVLTVYGHENVLNLWLEDGTNDNYHTR